VSTVPNDDDQNLAPDGDEWADQEDNVEDLGDLRVNFTSEEAAAESLKPIPPGRYPVTITKIDIGKSKSLKNPNKPYYKLQYTITDGSYKGRKLFDNIMLFEGALYSLSQLMKALGFAVSGGQVSVPKPVELMDRALVVRVALVPPTTSPDGKTYDERNEVKGYFSADSNKPTVDSLAP
jgi:hypothetical protein